MLLKLYTPFMSICAPENCGDHDNDERFVQVFHSSLCHLSRHPGLSSTLVPDEFFIVIVRPSFFLSFLLVLGSSFLQSITNGNDNNNYDGKGVY